MRRAKKHYPPPPPPNKNKKRFHASQTQINQGTGESPGLDPDILAVIVWSTDQASGADSLQCTLGKAKVIMNERTNHILKKARVQIAGNKCEKRAKGCAKLGLISRLDSLKRWYQASSCSKGGRFYPLDKFLSSGWRSWCIFIYWIAVVALSTLCRNHKA